MNVAEILHSNLCLLGYEKEASAAKLVLSDETFEHANERAFQSVVHFLLRTLDEERCRQTFRHCWPVLDKKQSSVFRQAVVAWLKEVKQSDPDGDALPQINPALFLSPGGRKFKDLLLALTQFVMIKSLRNLDSEVPGGEMILTRGDPEIQCGTLRAACALGKERFIQLQKTKLVSLSHHQRFADSFSAQYRRLRQSVSSLTVELGRLVAVSDLPPELTHRLLQENAGQVVPAVYGAARQHLASLVPALDRLRQFCAETEYGWAVADSIATGAVEESVVDVPALLAASQPAGEATSPSDLAVDGKLDLVAFFDTFVDRVEHLRQFLSHCPVGELKGLHGTLPPLVREATQLSSDAGRLLTQLQTETESVSRHLDRLLAAEPPPPPPPPRRARSVSPPPLLAPRTPNWSLSAAPLPPPGDHPLKHMYRSPAKDGVKLDLDLSAAAEPSSHLSSLSTTEPSGGQSPWASPAVPAHPSIRLTAPSPSERGASPSERGPGAGRHRSKPPELVLDTSRLMLSPGREGRSAAALSSCSSLFSPVCGAEGREGVGVGVGASPGLGSVSSLGESVMETARLAGDAGRSPGRGTASSPAGAREATAAAAAASAATLTAPAASGTVMGSPSPEVMRLREQTSSLLRSLTRSPAAGGDSVRPPSRGPVQRSPLLPLELSVTSGETRSAALHPWQAWREGRMSRSGPSSPLGAGLPRVAWQDGTIVGQRIGSPAAVEALLVGGRGRRRTRSGPGSTCRPLLDMSLGAGGELSRGRESKGGEAGVGVPPAAVSGVGVRVASPAAVESGVGVGVASPATAESGVSRSPQSTADRPADRQANFSQLEDEMAEALALSVFGPGDFNHSLDFSNRESLGGVEISLVNLDDSDCGPAPVPVPGPGSGSGRVEPPTDVLIDI